ncbi:MAG: luciferase domain-containing protein [Actinomycetota bacterium]
MQLDQQPEDATVREELARRVFALAEVEEQPSGISVPGARALCLRRAANVGPSEAFMVDREFAHLHPEPDMSLHLTLPEYDVEHAIERGWAELHPVARDGMIPPTAVMVFAPRDAEELEVVTGIVEASHSFARPVEKAAGPGSARRSSWWTSLALLGCALVTPPSLPTDPTWR